jgi:DNA-binding transcriptional ArsR family regulator
MPTDIPSRSVHAITDSLRAELNELTQSMCRALNDPKRLAILYALADGPLTVSEICDAIDAPQANTSQHLAVLRERGLIEPDRQGNNVYYSLRHARVIDAIDILRAIMSDELSRRHELFTT